MAGNIPDREEKIKNAICFFAFEHERLAHRPLTHTSLYKYLAFLDYASIEEIGRPALGLLYLSRVRHPLPIGTFARLAKLKKDRFVFLRRGGGRYLVKATGEPDVSYFSPLELREMKKLVETYALKCAKVCDAEGAPLNTTGSWKRRRIRTSEGSAYDEVFNDDFSAKYKEAYAMASLRALMEKYVAQIKEFETRMADAKHKLEIVMEASRLLAEEGLSDDYPPDRPGEER
jgi:hypothetical protein